MIAFNDLKRVVAPYKDQLEAAAQSVIDSGWFILGEQVTSFEREFASYLDVDFCFGVGNGTDALEIALKSVGVGPGDEVITVANAGFYTSSACNVIGAVPVYIDIDRNLLASAESLKNMIRPSTKAIVITHLFGQAVDIPSLRSIIGDIPIVEDCAEAHGARVNGWMVGSIGDVAAYSFYPTKNLGAIGDGGAVVTSDPAIATKIKQLRQYGWDSKYNSSIPYGRNSRLDEIQAAFLRVLLPHLEEMNDMRTNIVKRYRQAAPTFFEHLLVGECYVGHLAVAAVNNREAFQEYCREQEIATDIHFPVLDCDQVSMRDVKFEMDHLENSRTMINKIVSLPCYPGIPEDHINKICDVLSIWEKGNKIA